MKFNVFCCVQPIGHRAATAATITTLTHAYTLPHTHTHTHIRVHCLIKMHCLLLRALSSYAIAKRRNYLCAAYCVCNLYAYNARTHTHTHTELHLHTASRPLPLFGLLTPPLFMLHISCISFVLPTYQASCPATRTPHTARPQPDPPHPHARPRPPTPPPRPQPN